MFHHRPTTHAAIFIDSSYLIRTLKLEFENAYIDYRKLALGLAQPGEIVEIYYYSAYPYMSSQPTPYELRRRGNADRLFRSLRRIPGLTIRLGRVERRIVPGSESPRFEEKRVDVTLAVDLARLAATGSISRAVLVAGDSDFVPAVESAREMGVQVELVHGDGERSRPHKDLYSACDQRRTIDDDFVRRFGLRLTG